MKEKKQVTFLNICHMENFKGEIKKMSHTNRYLTQNPQVITKVLNGEAGLTAINPLEQKALIDTMKGDLNNIRLLYWK